MAIRRGADESRVIVAQVLIIVALLAARLSGASSHDDAGQQQKLSDLPAAATEEADKRAQDQQPIAAEAGDAGVREADLNAIKALFKQNFKRVREMHKEVVDSISSVRKYEIQYKLVDEIVDKIFGILELQKVILKNATESDDLSYLSTGNVKIDTFQATLDTLGNLALFSNIIHVVPDKMHRIMKKAKSEWSFAARWAYDLAEKTKELIEPSIFQMINLAMQELRIIEREPSYEGLGNEKSKTKTKTEKPKKPKRKREPIITRVDL